jgi:hypothetical protein
MSRSLRIEYQDALYHIRMGDRLSAICKEELKTNNKRSAIKTQNGGDKENNKQELIGDLTPIQLNKNPKGI